MPAKTLSCAMSILALVAFVPFGAAVRAAEIFVATTGSDATGTGAFAAPYRTLTHVLDPANAIVASGDVVTLRGPGVGSVYDECDVRLRVPLTLRSRDGERAHIRCDLVVEDSVAIQVDPDASGSRLSRLEVSGGFYYAIFLQTDWDPVAAPDGRGASNIVIEDSVIHDSGRDGIKITPKSDDVTIRRCEIARTGAIYPPGTPVSEKNAEGIDNVNGARMVVEDSHIHDTATTGVYFKGGATDAIVQRNVVERTGEAGILIGFDTSPEFFDLSQNPGYYEAIRGIVRNNLVRDTAQAGIGLYASKDAIVAHNTLVRTATAGQAAIFFGVSLQDYDPDAGRPPTVNPRLVNNIVSTPSGACIAVRWANEIMPEGLSGLDGWPVADYNLFSRTDGPCVFRDGRPGSPLGDGGSLAQWRAQSATELHSAEAPVALAPDGHLVAGSIAIDFGVALPQVTDDIDGDARDAQPDAGADEHDVDSVFRHGFEG